MALRIGQRGHGAGRDRDHGNRYHEQPPVVAVAQRPVLAALRGPLRSTELISCWDSDGPADRRGFAGADHCDHTHWRLDA